MGVRSTVVLSVLIAVLFCSQGNARMGPREGRGGPGSHPGPMAPGRPSPMRHPPNGARRIVVGDTPYWVFSGVYYRLIDDDYMVVSAPVVPILPMPYSVVVIRGSVLYVSDGIYYRAAPGGYIVVEKPVETITVHAEPHVAPAGLPAETRVLYVPKQTGGGFVPITLKKLEGGYLGPQGEFYPTIPQVAFLTEMYGASEEIKPARTDVFFIHIPNKDGTTFTRVELKQRGKGFIGPQGELYPLMPTVAHLVELYRAGRPPSRKTTESSGSVSRGGTAKAPLRLNWKSTSRVISARRTSSTRICQPQIGSRRRMGGSKDPDSPVEAARPCRVGSSPGCSYPRQLSCVQAGFFLPSGLREGIISDYRGGPTNQECSNVAV